VLCAAAGEFGQEQLLLGGSYQVHECKAALQHLHSSNIFGAALSTVLSALLGVRCGDSSSSSSHPVFGFHAGSCVWLSADNCICNFARCVLCVLTLVSIVSCSLCGVQLGAVTAGVPA
jgi:hypothetical protein